MRLDNRSLPTTIWDWFASLSLVLRAALSIPFVRGHAHAEETVADPDFEAWLQNDSLATGNPASRYRSQPPGYLTSNGRGSLEIGAAED